MGQGVDTKPNGEAQKNQSLVIVVFVGEKNRFVKTAGPAR
jgi:hypothetical protein